MIVAAKLASAFVGPPNGVLVFFLIPWFAGLGAVVGHLFPVWLGFKGGKGVATYIGVLIGVALMSRALWAAPVVFCLTWLVVAAITRYSSLSSLAATLATYFYFMAYSGPLIVGDRIDHVGAHLLEAPREHPAPRRGPGEPDRCQSVRHPAREGAPRRSRSRNSATPNALPACA